MHHAITLDALLVLDFIDKKGSFNGAAQALHRVPSALTYTIQKLETDLDIKLFDRSGRRAVLTVAGQLLLEQGRTLLQAAGRLEETLKQVESGWETHVRIARDTILPLRPLLEKIRAFNALDHNVAVHVSEEVLGGTWDALVADRCDLSLGASGEPPESRFECRKLGDVEFVFAVAPGHPLTLHKGPVTAAAIRAFPTVVAADSSLTIPGRSSGILDSRQLIRVSNMASKLEAQILGVGVGFVPRHLAVDLLEKKQLVALPCTVPRPSMPIYMAWRRENTGKALAWFVVALNTVLWLHVPGSRTNKQDPSMKTAEHRLKAP
ncbi:MAG: LysR family transcriptional regulator [Pseudomonadales bacterium]|nr:LysR family transcriptional regulator [Pseudomonadales bacterium]